MCCWTTNPDLQEHRFETGETVRYNGEPATVIQAYPVRKGDDSEPDYTVFTEDGEEVTVKEKELEPVKVEEEVEAE